MTISSISNTGTKSAFRFGEPASLLRGVQKVASLPLVYTKIIELLADSRTRTSDISNIIEKDPSLAARILRLANSAYFHQGNNVESIPQAIMTIGTSQMRDVVLASSITTGFKDIPSDIIDMNSFWRHSVACGIVARIIASLRQSSNIETAFVSGLLHDIGRLILFHKLPTEMAELIQQSAEQQIPLYQLEQKAFGFDHAVLGGNLLMQWRLPSAIVDTTLHHHNIFHSQKFITEATTINIANLLAKSFVTSHSGDANISTIETETWDLLGLKQEDIDLLKNEFDKQYTVAVDFVLD